jgi:hypothetical protein
MEASNRRGCLLPEPVQRAAVLLNIALGENRDGSHLVEDDALSVTRELIASENAPSASSQRKEKVRSSGDSCSTWFAVITNSEGPPVIGIRMTWTGAEGSFDFVDTW